MFQLLQGSKELENVQRLETTPRNSIGLVKELPVSP